MLLLIDNFDSFTYNLVQCFQVLQADITVVRNNTKTLHECIQMNPKYLVISPGPGTPAQAGVSKALIEYYSGKIPILGVCLGHQCIGELFGGHVVRAKAPMHGKTSTIYHQGTGVFANMPQGFRAMRYHSLIVARETLPAALEITAETAEGEIMGLRHREYPIEGVQFHPESIMSESGLTILSNFIHKENQHVEKTISLGRTLREPISVCC